MFTLLDTDDRWQVSPPDTRTVPMARLVITSVGTIGGFVPWSALGRRLRGRGHQVVMAINPVLIALAKLGTRS